MKIFLKLDRKGKKPKDNVYSIDEPNTGECCEEFGYIIHHYPTMKKPLTPLSIDNYKSTGPELDMRFCGIEDPAAQLSWQINFCPYCGEKFEIVKPKEGLECFS